MSISKLRKHKLRVNDLVFKNLFDDVEPVICTANHYSPDDIRYYISNGHDFRPVCDVVADSISRKHYSWEYQHIDSSILYSNEQHWVYAITVDHKIVKWGESLNPLGIKPQQIYWNYLETQPITGTKSRLGRYRVHGTDARDTDYRIRRLLNNIVSDPDRSVQFWARKCTEYREIMMIDGFRKTIVSSNNKAVERFYLDFFKSIYGQYPRLNKARA